MTDANHQIVRDFFSALASGNLPDTMLTADMTVWTTTSGAAPKEKYQGGVKLLRSLFDGQDFQNTYVFMFRIRDGRIAAVAEHFNPLRCTRSRR
jgi:ketosteroid isomerase-like protein